MIKPFHLLLTLFALTIIVGACSTIPENTTAISPFDKDRYLGKWYEIARFDLSFERNLNNTTATYSINPNGTIKVVNKGYNTVKEKWSEVEGKAKFIGADSVAMLKVSFFGPFYGGYNVIALDPEYKYALVSGGSLNYLWILSREKSIPNSVKEEYLRIAEEIGFDTSALLWVEHDQ